MGQPADGILMQGIAGSTRWACEYITGARTAGNEPCAPTTPMNSSTPGHDHSGGIMGAPQKHTVWSACFGYEEGGALSVEYIAPSSYVSTGYTTTYIPQMGFAAIRNLFVPGGVAYQRLSPEFILRADAACNYEIVCRGANGQEASKSGSLSVGNNTLTFTKKCLQFYPGKMQTFQFQIKLSYTAATARVYLLSATLHQDSDDIDGVT